MNIIDLLKQDHQEVSKLITQLQGGPAGGSAHILSQIKSALKLHTEIEEQIFYPALKNEPTTSDLISESYREHDKVDEILASISDANDPELQTKVEELRANVEHHVEEEENELFPKAQGVLGQRRLDEMGQQAEQMKRSMRAA